MRAHPERGSRRRGFVFVELLVVAAVLCLAAGGIWYSFTARAQARHCEANLLAIYSALELYEVDRGTLPRLAFFPDDPKQDNDSLVTTLQPYRSGAEVYACPSAPANLKDLGLTYVWNVALNGKKLHAPGAPTWMLVEINSLSDQVPAPHFGRYHILYTDGRVRPSRTPPPGLRNP